MQELSKLYPGHIETVKRHYEQALIRSGHEAVLICAGAPHTIFLDDMDYPFKANPHFKYWAPVSDNPHCYIYYKPGQKPLMLFHQPVDFWHKPADAPTDLWTKEFDVRLAANLKETKKSLPNDLANCALIGEWQTCFADWGVKKQHANVPTLLNYLHYHRAWKTPYELACLREAARLGTQAHAAAYETFKNGGSEYAIHQAFISACAHNEHELPYSNIVALNEHASVLHYQHQQREAPKTIRSFLIDAGAQFNGYASDITRTYAADKNSDFAQLIDGLDHAQQALCAKVKPGMDYALLQTATHHIVGGLLHDAGVLKPEAEEAVEAGLTRYFFPHGVGHYIGLQVHDVGGKLADDKGTPEPASEDQPFLRLTRTVEENQVFTIEPGLYFIEPLLKELSDSKLAKQVNWERVEELRPFGGIRIEDNIAVTSTGHENMTRAAFAAL
ncbi:MAG TPA: Xaa-Pro dipeptidase [Gammaproteobacteria bacterium]|nr:Xaa-Pro dipeptidase [Gammaproteobacteria bacterium]